MEVDGGPATPKALNDMLTAKQPGDNVMLKFSRNNTVQELRVTLGRNFRRTFQIQPMTNPTPGQTAILRDWLRPVQ